MAELKAPLPLERIHHALEIGAIEAERTPGVNHPFDQFRFLRVDPLCARKLPRERFGSNRSSAVYRQQVREFLLSLRAHWRLSLPKRNV